MDFDDDVSELEDDDLEPQDANAVLSEPTEAVIPRTFIESKNTIIDPFTHKRKRRFIDTLAYDLPNSIKNNSNTQTEYECYTKLRKLESTLNVSAAKRHMDVANRLRQRPNMVCTCCTSCILCILRICLISLISIH